MDQDSNQMEQNPVQCRNGCGFYSNARTEGLCSVCYKDMLRRKQQPPTGMPASLAPAPEAMAQLSINKSSPVNSASTSSSVESASPTVIFPSASSHQTEKSADSESDGAKAASVTEPDDGPVVASPATATTGDFQDGNKDGKKSKKPRCLSCKKKVGLTGFTCRCGGLFCSTHRYSDKHECNFDYKEQGAKEIRKSNPVIVANKVQKI